MVLTETGLAKVFQRVKSFVIAQLNSKASVLHTHTYSEIVDLPNGIAVDSTLDGTSSNAISNSAVSNALDGKSNTGHTHIISDIITDLGTLFDISNAGYIANLNNSALRVAGKVVVCSYNTNSSNNPTPGASGLCFTLANADSSYYGVQVALSNKGINARFINDGQYSAWGTIIK